MILIVDMIQPSRYDAAGGAWADDYTHGKQIVTNFFRVAGLV